MFLSNFVSLQPEEQDRLGCDELLKHPFICDIPEEFVEMDKLMKGPLLSPTDQEDLKDIAEVLLMIDGLDVRGEERDLLFKGLSESLHIPLNSVKTYLSTYFPF